MDGRSSPPRRHRLRFEHIDATADAAIHQNRYASAHAFAEPVASQSWPGPNRHSFRRGWKPRWHRHLRSLLAARLQGPECP
jgi:hypothetical protein